MAWGVASSEKRPPDTAPGPGRESYWKTDSGRQGASRLLGRAVPLLGPPKAVGAWDSRTEVENRSDCYST